MSSKRYPEEFKIEAVKQVIEYGHTVVDVAARLGMWFSPDMTDTQLRDVDIRERRAHVAYAKNGDSKVLPLVENVIEGLAISCEANR